jgi:hypothetical protein
VARIDFSIASNNAFRPGATYNRTSWIVQAIRERLAKLERSRSVSRKRKGAAAAAEIQAEPPPDGTVTPAAYEQGEPTRNELV